MSDARYHFMRVKTGEAPKWWSTRTNRDQRDEHGERIPGTGTMYEWIADLEKRYDVIRHNDQPRVFLLCDKVEA